MTPIDRLKVEAARIVLKYGFTTQMTKAIEEMSELTHELCRGLINDPRSDVEKLREEIDDVMIMVYQLRLIYNPDSVDKYIDKKLDRVLSKLTEAPLVDSPVPFPQVKAPYDNLYSYGRCTKCLNLYTTPDCPVYIE